ncbi:MAG: DUF2442 domain-containing protein [Oscillibacter sp.]|nr:DUF2442 domain-containing protein [Oscillibacter sp.]
MKKDAAYYMSRGFDAVTAQYFADGRRKPVAVAANPDFTLTIRFDNDETRIYDAKPLLKAGTVFEPFANFENFRRVYVDHENAVAWDIDPEVDSNIVWGNKVDLSPDACYLESRPA